jgi:hypothetical protein
MMTEPREIDCYLQRLDSRLCGSPRYRNQLLVEIRTHLCDITEAAGCSAADAVERFGDADKLAQQLNKVLSAKRRQNLRRFTTGIAAAAVAAVAAGGIHGTGDHGQMAAPQTGAQRQPLSVILDPRTGMVVASQPLSGTAGR